MTAAGCSRMLDRSGTRERAPLGGRDLGGILEDVVDGDELGARSLEGGWSLGLSPGSFTGICDLYVPSVICERACMHKYGGAHEDGRVAFRLVSCHCGRAGRGGVPTSR